MADAQGIAPVGTVRKYAGRGDMGVGWFLCDGRVLSRVSYAKLFATICPLLATQAATNNSTNITVTGHNLQVNDSLHFPSPSGGLSATTLYYVVAVVDANTFRVSATIGGAALTVTSTGSQDVRFCPYGLGDGSTTFNLPDCRGRVPIAPDDMKTARGAAGRGVPLAALGRSAGGSERVTLTAAQSSDKGHTHGGGVTSGHPNTGATQQTPATNTTGGGNANTPYGGGHSHSFGGGSGGENANHYHNAGVRYQTLSGANSTTTTAAGGGANYTGMQGLSANHSHGVSGGTGGRSTEHTHSMGTPSLPFTIGFGPLTIASDSAAATAAHNNMPPFLVVNRVIRVI